MRHRLKLCGFHHLTNLQPTPHRLRREKSGHFMGFFSLAGLSNRLHRPASTADAKGSEGSHHTRVHSFMGFTTPGFALGLLGVKVEEFLPVSAGVGATDVS